MTSSVPGVIVFAHENQDFIDILILISRFGCFTTTTSGTIDKSYEITMMMFLA